MDEPAGGTRAPGSAGRAVGDREILEGFVVDLACVRKFPREALAERARSHTRECALMPHCVESGYALVDEAGGLAALDPHATPGVLEAVRASGRTEGIRLRVTREPSGEHMQTTAVEEV